MRVIVIVGLAVVGVVGVVVVWARMCSHVVRWNVDIIKK